MRTSHKAKDAAAEKQSYVCDTFTGHGQAHQPPLPGSPVCVLPVMHSQLTGAPPRPASSVRRPQGRVGDQSIHARSVHLTSSRSRGVKVTLGAGAQFRTRLLEDLGAGFQRGAQFLRGSDQIRAMETTDDSDELSRGTVLGTCDLTRLRRIRVFAGHKPVGVLPRRSDPGHVVIPQAAPSLVVRPLTCNDGRITRIWSLPATRRYPAYRR
jgi:hypothetical protein